MTTAARTAKLGVTLAMQNVVIEEPYVPVLPHHGGFWPRVFSFILPWFLRKTYGIAQIEFRHVERLQASLNAGHGILLMPNHCRDEDGLIVGSLSCKVSSWFFYMSSWHVFKLDRVKAFLLPRLGLFSTYREGADRASVKVAVDMLASAERPLVIFPEGFLGRTNDRLNALMDGAALIARTAAKKRAQNNPPGQIIVHPVALRYRFLGNVETAVAGVLAEIETRLALRPDATDTVLQRVVRIGETLLAQKEKEYLGHAQTGPLAARQVQLIQAILTPLEDEWLGHQHDGAVQARVRRLRATIVPDLAKGGLSETERQRRWRQLAGIYLAQQLDNYPRDYLAQNPPPERLLETIERFEEDLTDKVRPHGPLGVTVTIGEAILVNPVREGRGTTDPLLREVEYQLRNMLGLTSVPAAQP